MGMVRRRSTTQGAVIEKRHPLPLVRKMQHIGIHRQQHLREMLLHRQSEVTRKYRERIHKKLQRAHGILSDLLTRAVTGTQETLACGNGLLVDLCSR